MPPKFDPGKDCRIASTVTPGLKIILSPDHSFERVLEIDSKLTVANSTVPVKNRTFTATLKAKRGDVAISENWLLDEYRAMIRIERGSFIVTQFNNLDEDGAPSDTFTVHLTLKQGHNVVFETGGNKKPHPVSGGRDPQFFTKLSSNTLLYHKKDNLPGVRHVKIVIPNYRNLKNYIFNEEIGKKILNQEMVTKSNIVPEHFVSLQKGALQGEDVLQAEKNKTLIRHNVTGTYFPLQGYTDRWFVTLNPNAKASDPNWMLQGQERVIFSDTKQGIFSRRPTATPGKKSSLWRGTIFFQENTPCARIDNTLNPALIEAMKSEKSSNSITIKIDDQDDPVVERQFKALRHLNEILHKQVNPDYEPKIPGIRLVFHIPPTGIFMSGQRGLIKRNVQPLLLTGDSELTTVLANPRYQFTRDSHKSAVINMMTSPSGISLIQGPPATGKTEMVAKLIGFTLTRTNLSSSQSVVLSAHTNVAVAVACSRFLKVNANVFQLENNVACLIWSENKAEYGRLIGKDLPAELKNITLDAHVDRLANQNKVKYKNFLQGRSEIEKRGRIEDDAIRRRYINSLRALMEMVKKYVRVWFCTLATFHLEQHIFGTENGGTGIDCGLLIIDEASQAHTLAAWLPWLVVNPRRIVLAGDHQQLAPYYESTEAEWAWRTSLFEELREDPVANIPNVTLDLQFRTTKNIYAGTNAFYDGRIESFSVTIDRPLYKQLMQAVKRISFVDKDGKKQQLSNNTHWFDIKNGKVTTNGDTSSSLNADEVRFIAGLFNALYVCSIPPRECLLLTGYQATYDSLLATESAFPNPGTLVKKVDGAQGDEAGVVGLTLVRNATTGLGFMSQARRQNVFTSRARDGLYGVGQVLAMQKASERDAGSWWKWFLKMKNANGPNWCISFNAPVVWSVDNKPIAGPLTKPRAATISSTATPVTVAAEFSTPVIEEAQSRRSSTSAGSPQGSPSTTSQPRTPRQISLDQTLRQSGPSGSPSPRSPNSPTSGDRRPSSSGFPAAFVGGPTYTTGSSSAQSPQGSISRPRQPSLLNPQVEGRRTSSTLSNPQSLPSRVKQPPLFSTTFVQQVVTAIQAQTKEVVRENVKNRTIEWKNSLKSQAEYDKFKKVTEDLYKALLDGDNTKFNQIVKNAKDQGFSEQTIERCVILAHAKVKLWKTATILVPWP